MFANKAAFDHPSSRMWALGMVPLPGKGVVGIDGKVLFHPQTGGMIQPLPHELRSNTILFRFCGGGTPAPKAVTGGWWVERSQFEKICAFAEQRRTSVAMAARLLCCVPPEWSDMGLLIRARVRDPLLAWRGLGNSVVTPAKDSLGDVRMPAHNDIAARRLYQLYIPGLGDVAKGTMDRRLPGSLLLEESWTIKKEEANKGWLYL